MIYPISLLSGTIYRQLAKPLLFRASPDKVHADMIKVGSFVQRFRFLNWLMRVSWSYKNDEYLKQEILGQDFANPIGMSAGLDKNFEIAAIANSIGFGQIEGGSVTFEECAGNERPWFYRLPKTKSIVVNVGLANKGVKFALGRISKYNPKQLGQMRINVSVAYTNSKRTKSEADAIADYVGSLKLINKDTRVNFVTLNISCPNTYGGEPFTTPEKLERLLMQIDKVRLQKPLFVKMPIDKSDKEFESLLGVISKHNVQGVTISNLFKNRSQAELKDNLPDDIAGNLSGKPTFDRSNELIRIAYKKFGDKLIISGVGGVFTAEDAYIKIRAGASLVEMVTALMFEGPQVVGQINCGLVKLLKRDGYENISQAIGVDVER